jgi:RNA polymerase sigma factor (sigma-70 family)
MQEENDILAFLQNGQLQNAFNKIVDAYSERLYWHIRKIVHVHEDADDTLQNTFINVWRALPKFKGQSKVYTWLYRIATNEALSLLRSQKPKKNNAETVLNKAAADVYFDGEHAQALLWQAIENLPDKQRLVFIMKYFDDKKYDEMSEILNTSIGALKASYHHATQKIKQFVTEEKL